MQHNYPHCQPNKGNGRWFGAFIVLLGLGLLLKRLEIDLFPDWLFSLPAFIIAAGLFIGIRQRFRHIFPLLLIAIGSIFLFKRIYGYPLELEPFVWPVLIIIIGLAILFKPKRTNCWEEYTETRDRNTPFNPNQADTRESASDSDSLDSIAVFCGTKKNILSKNFKGGETVIVFGGSELNFTQADIQGKAVIDITVVFGGMKIVVPANWDVNINVMNVAAGIEDKRILSDIQPNPDKVLVIKGTLLFGGLDIHNH